MTYDGYLAFGGKEIVNSERARGYAMSAACPMPWLKDAPCLTLPEAVGDSNYLYSGIVSSPWFDSTVAEISSRFYGVYGLAIDGVEDSTRTAEKTEGIADGGVIGRPRRAMRDVKVKAWLMGKGQDALEYGMSWLSASLDPDACGQISLDCGTAEMAVFSTCPPDRQDVAVYGAWANTRLNMFTDPRGLTTSSAQWNNAVTGSYSLITDMPLEDDGFTSGVRFTASSTSGGGLRAMIGGGMPAAGANVRFMAAIRASQAVTVQIIARPQIITSTGQQVIATVNLVPGINYVDVYGPSFAGAATSTSGISITTTTTYTAGMTLDISRVLVEAGTWGLGPWFDGGVLSTDTAQATWTGTEFASTSQLQNRSVDIESEDDVAYARRVDDSRRYMRNAGVISGPTKLSEQQSNGFWAYEVQFVLSGGPAILGVTRAVTLEPTTPTIVTDLAENLVTYPSAELASGTVVTATNHSINPSVETNNTGWAVNADGTLILVANVVSARATGVTDLWAVGIASQRARWTTPGANAGPQTNAWFGSEQVVTLPGGAPAGTRYSVNMWSASNVESGTAVLGALEVYAIWRNSSNVVLRTDLIGTVAVPGSGGAVFQTGILPPAGAANVVVQSRQKVVSWASGAILRNWSDALAVTVP